MVVSAPYHFKQRLLCRVSRSHRTGHRVQSKPTLFVDSGSLIVESAFVASKVSRRNRTRHKVQSKVTLFVDIGSQSVESAFVVSVSVIFYRVEY